MFHHQALELIYLGRILIYGPLQKLLTFLCSATVIKRRNASTLPSVISDHFRRRAESEDLVAGNGVLFAVRWGRQPLYRMCQKLAIPYGPGCPTRRHTSKATLDITLHEVTESSRMLSHHFVSGDIEVGNAAIVEIVNQLFPRRDPLSHFSLFILDTSAKTGWVI